ncbi:MAG TPA: SpoIIE family protein phosphatase [Bryobacteraceae bacterium]|nr:SpoIIE family protein phosphatase [Bryobacteraceae bacterium]
MSRITQDEGPAESGQHPYLRIHIVEVYVRNQEQSLAFYRDQLGFEVVVDTGPQDWGRWAVVAPPVRGTAVLALVEASPNLPSGIVGRRTGVTLVTDNIAVKFEEWSRKGIRFPQLPTPVPWGFHASFEDLDGNQFSLIQNPHMVDMLNVQRRQAEQRREAERRAALEAEIARNVQSRLFPQVFPPMKTLDCAAACFPAQHVGGDYYDLLELRPGRTGLVIADISGKGVSGALLMANLQANLRIQYAMAVDNLPGLLASVNRLFYRNTESSSYATMFFADYDDISRTLRYANCGHVSPLLLRSNGDIERLTPTCTVVGLFEAWQCETAETRLHAGDTLVLYSDGVVEAESSDGTPFGEERLIEVLQHGANRSAQDLLRAIVDATLEFSGGEQLDDITLVVARALTSAP